MMNFMRRSVQAASQRRYFAGGGHGHEAKHYEGLEAVVRKYLPEDHHIVMGTLGAYAGLFVLVKLFKGKSKPAPVEEEGHRAPETKDDIPSIFSDKFDKWSKQPGNMAKWEKSLGKWEKQMEDPKYAANYSKSLAL